MADWVFNRGDIKRSSRPTCGLTLSLLLSSAVLPPPLLSSLIHPLSAFDSGPVDSSRQPDGQRRPEGKFTERESTYVERMERKKEAEGGEAEKQEFTLQRWTIWPKICGQGCPYTLTLVYFIYTSVRCHRSNGGLFTSSSIFYCYLSTPTLYCMCLSFIIMKYCNLNV